MVPNSGKKSCDSGKSSGREAEREVSLLDLAVRGAPASIHSQRPRSVREYKAYRFVREEKRGRDVAFPVDRIVYLAERLELTSSADLSGVAGESSDRGPPAFGRKRGKRSGPSEPSALSLDLSSVAGEESDEDCSDSEGGSAPRCNTRSSSFREEPCETSRLSGCRCFCELGKPEERKTDTCCDLINFYVNSVDKQKDLTRFFRPCHACKEPCCVCPESSVRTDPGPGRSLRRRSNGEARGPERAGQGPAGGTKPCSFDSCCPEFFETEYLTSFCGGECYCSCRTDGASRSASDSSVGSDRILAYTSSLASAARSARVLARDLELVLSTFRNENEKRRTPQIEMSYLCGAAKHMPLILCVVTPVSMLITYGIAVGNDHVSAFWPYISDTGTKPPESCIFGLLLSSIAFLLCAIIYLRYRYVSEFAKLNPSVGILPAWNRVAACFGFLSAFGLHLVANFQELNEFVTHIVGAMLCFFSAILYFFLQTVFTRKMLPKAKRLLWARIAFTFLNVLFIVGTFAPIGAATKDFKGDILKWTVNDAGFLYHAISTFSEWLLVLSFCGYICTLHWEFRDVEIEPPQIKFRGREDRTEIETSDVAEEGKARSLWI